jgi:(2Fe-2S) ferredoxin
MFTAEELKSYVESHPKQVRRMPFAVYPELFVLKYKHEVFWEGKWNRFLRECRGLVVDRNYNPVIRPFTKIFNLDEQGARYAPDRMVYAERKVNGFMAGATYVPMYGEVIVSTTGSLDSDFTKMAREMLELSDALEVIKSNPVMHNHTWLFEIVHPNDPHIVKEQTGAYLLSSRPTGFWSAPARDFTPGVYDGIAEVFGCLRAEWTTMSFSSLEKLAGSCKHEGYVVYPMDDIHGDAGLKIKSPYYKTTKWFARMKPEKMEKILKNVDELKKEVDEEFFPLIDKIASEPESFYNLSEQDRITYVEKFFGLTE